MMTRDELAQIAVRVLAEQTARKAIKTCVRRRSWPKLNGWRGTRR